MDDHAGATLRTTSGTQIKRIDYGQVAVHFVGEQLGPAERAFKEALLPGIKQKKSILRAYLARVRYGDDKDARVALCIRCEGESIDEGSIGSLADTFHDLFNSAEQLDIIPISAEDEPEVIAASRPFYIRDLSAKPVQATPSKSAERDFMLISESLRLQTFITSSGHVLWPSSSIERVLEEFAKAKRVILGFDIVAMAKGSRPSKYGVSSYDTGPHLLATSWDECIDLSLQLALKDVKNTTALSGLKPPFEDVWYLIVTTDIEQAAQLTLPHEVMEVTRTGDVNPSPILVPVRIQKQISDDKSY